MSSCVCATGHMKEPLPLIQQSMASCPDDRWPPSFIHQVIIITELNKFSDWLHVLPLHEDGLKSRQGGKATLKLKT